MSGPQPGHDLNDENKRLREQVHARNRQIRDAKRLLRQWLLNWEAAAIGASNPNLTIIDPAEVVVDTRRWLEKHEEKP